MWPCNINVEESDVYDMFRQERRELSATEAAMLRDVKSVASELGTLILNMQRAGHPAQGRYQSLALTALEQCVMWAVKGITS